MPQLRNQAELDGFTNTVIRLKTGQDRGKSWLRQHGHWLVRTGASWKWQIGSCYFKQLPISHGYNRDVDLESVLLLWFNAEQENKLWKGYSDEDTSGQPRSFQYHAASSGLYASFAIRPSMLSDGLLISTRGPSTLSLLEEAASTFKGLHFGKIRTLYLLCGHRFLNIFLASPGIFSFLVGQAWLRPS